MKSKAPRKQDGISEALEEIELFMSIFYFSYSKLKNPDTPSSL